MPECALCPIINVEIVDDDDVNEIVDDDGNKRQNSSIEIRASGS